MRTISLCKRGLPICEISGLPPRTHTGSPRIYWEQHTHLRPLHTSILDIYKVLEPSVCYLKGTLLHPYTATPAKLAPNLSIQVHLRNEYDATTTWFCWHPLQTTSHIQIGIYKVLEPLICCLKGILLYPYTVTPAKLPPDLGIQVHLRSGKYATTFWLRLISTSEHFIHPYLTYTKCLSYWYAVSRAYCSTLIPLHWPSWPQIWEVRVSCGVKMMPLHHGWGWYPPQTTSYIHIRHIKSF